MHLPEEPREQVDMKVNVVVLVSPGDIFVVMVIVMAIVYIMS